MRTTVLVLAGFLGACAAGTEAGEADNGANQPDAGVVDPGASESNCQDGLDDDGDTAVDCDDEDCFTHPACRNGETRCDDGVDNDSDSSVDCQDEDCDGMASCEFRTELSCDDGVDNDADLQVDCNDADCAASAACAPEMICDDGVDNDNDTRIDCLDEHCDTIGICEFGVEKTCNDGEDNDGDGQIDCDDSDCGGALGCATACAPGSTAVILDPANMPLTIADNSSQFSSLTAAGTGIVTLAAVTVEVTHSYTGDVVLALEGPSGTQVELSNRNGGGGDNFSGTLFVDSAPTSISSASPPFTGGFKPQQSLEAFIGESFAGDWKLHANDVAGGIDGTLDDWQLLLCTCTNCEAGAACNDGMDNDGDSMTDCDDPDCAGNIRCIPESVCDDSLDSDLDGLVDCLDDDCDTVGICEFATEATCDDGEDNDGDGDVDCADTDCSGVTECIPEADCHDGMDNDGDSLTDCQDPGCFSDATCEPAGEVTCSDGVDNDSDGVADCDDPNCALACAQPACAAGEVTYGFAAGGLPIAIVDNATVTASVNIDGAGTVTRAVVLFSATHTFDGDLDISLASPAGTSIVLSDDNGSSDDNYTDTVFSDAATTDITAGTAPFTGSFKPEVALSTLNGESVAGEWILSVADDAGSDTGNVTAFELALCVQP